MREIQPEIMRNHSSISHFYCMHFIESCNMQSKNNVHSSQQDDYDIQKELIEVWMDIEESIRIYELANEKQNRIKTISKEFK